MSSNKSVSFIFFCLIFANFFIYTFQDTQSDKDNHTARDPTPSEDAKTARDPTTSEDNHTARDPTTSEDNHTARDPTASEDNHTARDPTTSESNHTARDPTQSEQANTTKEPGTDTERSNKQRIQKEWDGPVQETFCFQQVGGFKEEYVSFILFFAHLLLTFVNTSFRI